MPSAAAKIVLGAVSAAYPLLWDSAATTALFLVGRFNVRPVAAACAHTARARPACGGADIGGFFCRCVVLRLPQSMYWYPRWVSLLMLALFGGSLFAKQSLIAAARPPANADLPPEGVRYTRRVTQIWCVFFCAQRQHGGGFGADATIRLVGFIYRNSVVCVNGAAVGRRVGLPQNSVEAVRPSEGLSFVPSVLGAMCCV